MFTIEYITIRNRQRAIATFMSLFQCSKRQNTRTSHRNRSRIRAARDKICQRFPFASLNYGFVTGRDNKTLHKKFVPRQASPLPNNLYPSLSFWVHNAAILIYPAANTSPISAVEHKTAAEFLLPPSSYPPPHITR